MTLPPPQETAQQLLEYVAKQRNGGTLEVPILPEIAGKVIQLTQDKDSNSLQLSILIQSDQALAGHVMRIANSAAYSPNTTLVSLQQAITRLGIDLLAEVALAASISTKMFKTPGFSAEVSDVWRHALATALWAKEISRHCRLNVEATFLCGLLHSIGWPVALQTLLEGVNRLGLACDKDTILQLSKQLEQEVGLAVLAKWQMPVIIIETVQYYHNYHAAPQASRQAMIVNAAAQFASHCLHPDLLPQEQLLSQNVMVDLNLYQDEIQALLEKSATILATLEVMGV